MKNIVIVAPYFPPSNLTGVHRSRFLAMHLPKFGWQPTILTVRAEYYEEKQDVELEGLLPKDLRIVRTKAFKTKPIRLVGYVSLRCFLWHWAELRRLAIRKEIDIIYISIFPAYSSLLGRLVYEEFKIPYGIDYQDPWIEYRKSKGFFLSKARLSQWLAKILEPIAVKKAGILSGVSARYFQGVLDRNPHLTQIPRIEMPIGIEPSDHTQAAASGKKAYLFEPVKGRFDFVYAGALLPEALDVWRSLFQALKDLQKNNNGLFKKLRIHCMGTGSSPDDPEGYRICPMAQEYGLYGHTVIEYPARIPYLDILTHLNAADGILVVGSIERHYTASKVFQAVFSRKPILAILHKESTAFQYLGESHAANPIGFLKREELACLGETICKEIERIVSIPFDVSRVNYEYFNPFTAETLTERFVEVLNTVVS